MKKIKSILILCSCVALAGCASVDTAREGYKKAGWTPDQFNYTLQRDRHTGDMSDYFGLGWSLK